MIGAAAETVTQGLAGAFASPGLFVLLATCLAAGVVRGFAGFGSALIIMPVAGIFLPVPTAIVVVLCMGMLTWPVIVPRAAREADRGQVAVLAVAAIACAPLGLWLLGWLSGEMLRWCVSGAAAVTLLALVSGWRYSGRVRWPGLAGVGAAAGVLGGTTGLSGPPVILFYLAGPSGAAVVRANTILFLALLDIGIILGLLWQGRVTGAALWLALLLAIPYAVGILVGQRLFAPERERAYRWLAYGVIALAIVSGLPIFHR
ncbi:TSUP family transporter [Pseudooceanicola marinus]|uniref:TSUP family transporter n=1 Tax=Pseudooceanicola marinus TaxID=396013 RepID=UPI001CD6865F|nr:TSUP family transporter [Pseudooceanicola marinus]MCA1334829.1 TSUP family transporter [Pseudooceanicola marinus]